MNTKLKNLFQQLLQSPRRFPVEAALGLVFFIIGVLDLNKNLLAPLNADILWLFAPLVVFSFWLQRVNRWAYLASFFLFLPLMCLNLKPFLWTFGFGFTYVLAAILLVLGNRRMDNRSFAAHALQCCHAGVFRPACNRHPQFGGDGCRFFFPLYFRCQGRWTFVRIYIHVYLVCDGSSGLLHLCPAG